jgi:hypothetical protein
MQSIKSEVASLIRTHFDALTATAEELGGVFITATDGAVAVMGAENSRKKIIFLTSFVSTNSDHLLDAQVLVQDLLEEQGIEAISEHDFNIALGEL